MALILAIAPGCSPSTRRMHAIPIDAGASGLRALEEYDENHDGAIEMNELERCPSLRHLAEKKKGENGRPSVSAADITEKIREWQASQVARVSFGCMVLRNGRPLVRATVRLVPEAFLGDQLPTAVGLTDESGTAVVTIPLENELDPPGVPPGFYRVEITRPGDSVPVPEQYNRQSIFGEEIGPGDAHRVGARQFNLAY